MQVTDDNLAEEAKRDELEQSEASKLWMKPILSPHAFVLSTVHFCVWKNLFPLMGECDEAST